MNRILAMLALGCAAFAHDGGTSNVAPRKLAYLLPNLFGPGGFVLPNPDHAAHFSNAFQSNFGPLMSSVTNQLTTVPLPSPASGFLYSFDTTLGVYTRTGQSFGPIFAERAETIGKNKFFAGVAYQHYNFDHIDGIDMKKLNAVFEHQPAANILFQRDVITTQTQLDIQVGQTVAYFTYGLHDRVDVSVALPMVTASIDALSDAQIQRIGTGTDGSVHFFDTTVGDRSRAQFAASGTAQGIGDVTVRLKATALRFKSAGVAVGFDARMPTGDELNLLGSGTYGMRPFIAISGRKGNLSPHVNFAYQWNGQSYLAGNVVTGTTGNLTDQLQYAAGFDLGVTPKFTLAMDYLGIQQLNGKKVERTRFTAFNGATFDQSTVRDARVNQHAAAVGFKVNPIRELLVSFNLLFALNDAGLRDRVSPLIGVAYTF